MSGPAPEPVILVMGVSGSGKSTLARSLAEELGAVYLEGDRFHPPANVAHMKAGKPLTDEMRWGWLESLGRAAAEERAAGRQVVMTCSALKRSYRDLLRREAGPLAILFLHGEQDKLAARLRHRKTHYMPASLLPSQLATLEPPGPDEPDTARLPIRPAPAVVLRLALEALATLASRGPAQ
ncbi:gluconokinase [Frigidibacter sp. ROC022]|uniref:gluconokinase n=1 Tax=Frigidibacter sp. ROC022 TaxID=2971796 RepID=UPI00215AB09B|nr:gluconokinase [Frigidibacter sp. ROC022]MCR8726373.1 gluconokinase [Frigidibacter sp. ROC022]